MHITTLGSLAVDGRPVRGERLAAVVRELVGARGRAVSTAALVDAVWDGAPPDDAAGAVQALISRVRRLGLPVAAVPGGYRVPAEDVDVDAVRARDLTDRGRAALRAGDPAEARRCADAARALFPEVPELTGTDDIRLLADVAALRAEAALAGEGPFDEADLRRLAAHTPPDEPSAALLVRVLAAQGRAAEAMDVIERLREELATRYGADPSPIVTETHVALLRGELIATPADRPARAPVRRTAVLPAAWRRPVTPMVGREADVTAVLAALDDAPLVTVVAVGGAGKTRLAAEVARRVLAAGRTVHVVELAGLRSAAEVLPALQAALVAADPARPTMSPVDRLREATGDGLVVLDNCEHLLAGAATAVAELLAVASPELTVLATSRAPLSLPGEVVYRLRALPDPDALDLLRARARAGGAALAWSEADALELCHRLDNLPLALELAAARLRHMPIADVLAGLSDRFALLDDALRGLPDRHASLWAMVDWSRELLGPGDRELLERLAVIPAPFTAEAAARVAGRPEVRRGLATLAEQSLLGLQDGDDGRPRYRILETVREYGEVRLDAAGGRAEAMAGLTGWARAEAVALIAETTAQGGLRQIAAYTRCGAEQENLVAALRWAHARDDGAAVADIAAVLFQLWTVRGMHQDVVRWAETLLHDDDPVARRRSTILHGTAAGPGDRRELPDPDRLTWLCLYVGLNAFVGDRHRLFALARTVLRSLDRQRPGLASPRAAALAAMLPALANPDVDTTLPVADRLIADPDSYVQGFGYFLRSIVSENRGMTETSTQDAEEAYRRFERSGDHWGMGIAAQSIGARGDGPAGEWLRRGVRHMELIGATQDVDSLRVLLDIQLALAGDADAALRLRRTGAEEQADGGVQPMAVAQAQLGLAQLGWQQGRYADALAHADRATAIADEEFLVPQVRVVLRVAVAVLRLRIAVVRPGPGDPAGADARAVAMLRLARAETLSSSDIPVFGSWSLGGAALAAHRGDRALARELWALGLRAGANVMPLFQFGAEPDKGERLEAALGTGDEVTARAAELRKRSVTEVTDRIVTLMDELLTGAG